MSQGEQGSGPTNSLLQQRATIKIVKHTADCCANALPINSPADGSYEI